MTQDSFMRRYGWYEGPHVQWHGRTGPSRSHICKNGGTKCGTPIRPVDLGAITHSTAAMATPCRRCHRDGAA